METEISLDRFTLNKVKILPDGGLFADWDEIKKNGALTDMDQNDKTSTREPHPDLVAKIETLKPLLAKMWGVNYAVIVAESKDFGGKPDHIDAMKRAYIEQLKDITVTGISVKGKGEKMAVVITGKRRMYKKIYQPCNSGRIQLNQKLYGFENDLQDIVPEIVGEVFEYLFKGKCQSPTLFGEGSENNENPKDETKTVPRKKGEAQAQLKTV